MIDNANSDVILIAGGAGFIGSHLIDRLLMAGHQVLCVDNLHTGTMRNLEHLMGLPGFSFARHDVTQPFAGRVSAIYNLACPASPVHYLADPVRTWRTSVLGAMHLLDLAENCSCRILQASTSEVYGDPLVHPQPESYWGHANPIGPRACYNEGKRCAETLFRDYREHRGLDVRVARIFNTYGPRMALNDGRVVTNFIAQALQDRPITIQGDGLQTRSFCYVDDLIEGLVSLMESDRTEATRPINLGNPEEVSMIELAELVIELTGSKSKIEFVTLPEDDPRHRKPDISRARELLTWQPTIPLRKGLERTIVYLARRLAREALPA